MKTTVMKRIDFCAGHRLVNHGGKCENFHGHNYRLEVYVTSEELDDMGRVIDFSEIKNVFKTWIDDNWDHGFILAASDQNGIDAIKMVKPYRLFIMEDNPTAENLARYLMQNVAAKIVADNDRLIEVSRIVLWETETSFAEVHAPEYSKI